MSVELLPEHPDVWDDGVDVQMDQLDKPVYLRVGENFVKLTVFYSLNITNNTSTKFLKVQVMTSHKEPK